MRDKRSKQPTHKFAPSAEPTRKTQQRQEVIERAIPKKMHPRPTCKFQARLPYIQPQVLLLIGRGGIFAPPVRKEQPFQNGSATATNHLASASSLDWSPFFWYPFSNQYPIQTRSTPRIHRLTVTGPAFPLIRPYLALF